MQKIKDELMVLENWADAEIKTKTILGVSFVPLAINHKEKPSQMHH